ncbi:PP2C family protein-serine/threonine phosphatase [Tundrisphaera lichenicola]|uniref:PP2C family protein-serine/threonine phosphatase n=1 Tax=Tundrisphaera lichenicola TaxID=2029860 RepID=UPI003EBD91EE
MPISDVQHFTGGVGTIDRPDATPGPVKVKISCGALTHPGKVRQNNEDHFLVARLAKSMQICQSSLDEAGVTNYSEEDGYLMVVADGMGGAAAGERASALAVESVKEYALNTLKWFLHVGRSDESILLSELRKSLELADKAVVDEGEANARLYGMGTTLTMAYLIGADLYIAHAGDSRAYLLRDGNLEQITSDHTLVQLMISGGILSAEDAKHHARRNIVTNVIGGPNAGVHAEIHKLKLIEGDVLLLCTDGLTEPVEDDQIAEILRSTAEPEAAALRLIEQANEKGGPDNVTAVVARYSLEVGDSLGQSCC